jgi:hypothetical protein
MLMNQIVHQKTDNGIDSFEIITGFIVLAETSKN